MERACISARQLFMLAILFEHGSAMVIPLGVDAKQDVWLAILCGMVLGGGLLFIYYRLFTYYPRLPLTSYSQRIVGSFLERYWGLYMYFNFYTLRLECYAISASFY